MKVQIKNRSGVFEADPVELPGTPPVGRGASIEEALGNLVIHYQKELGIEIELDPSAAPAEHVRRMSVQEQR